MPEDVLGSHFLLPISCSLKNSVYPQPGGVELHVKSRQTIGSNDWHCLVLLASNIFGGKRPRPSVEYLPQFQGYSPIIQEMLHDTLSEDAARALPNCSVEAARARSTKLQMSP